MNPAAVRDSYRRSLEIAGRLVTVRRYTGTGSAPPSSEARDIMARVTGYEPAELVGGISQADRKIIVLVDDLVRRQFALPVRLGDRVVVGGDELTVEAVDDQTRRVAGELIAYEIQARG